MNTLSVKWTGIRPLVMHNGLLADHMNPYSKQIREITSKGSKKMQPADHERRDRFEWEGSLYWSDSDGLIMPSDNIERCIQLGGQKSRIGKDIQAAVFVADEIIKVEYDGPKNIDALYKDVRFQLRKGVQVNGSRITRVRPMIPTGWSIKFDLEYDDTIVSEDGLKKANINAGALVGLCDWRPKFGRFSVEFF